MDDESEILLQGSRLPFVQQGMVIGIEADDGRVMGEMLVSDTHDTEHGVDATLTRLDGTALRISCASLRSGWRLVRDFDADKIYTGRFRMVAGRSVAVAEEVDE